MSDDIIEVRPEDCFPIDILATTTETVKAGAPSCPTKRVKKIIYYLFGIDTSAGANQLTVRTYSAADVLQSTVIIPLPVANDYFVWSAGGYASVLSIEPGHYVTFEALADSIQLHAMAYNR